MQKSFRVWIGILLALLLSVPCFGAQTLIPGGEAVGLTFELPAPCVIKTEKGSPAAQAGLRAGDRIISVDRRAVNQASALLDAVQTGKPLIVGVIRDGKNMTFTVYPKKTEAGWRIGAEVMDRIDGIGTITYFDPQNKTFGALGHGVNPTNTKETVSVSGGTAYAAQVHTVEKSESGDPGELKGVFSDRELGIITVNSENGVFGTLTDQPEQGSAVPIATASQVHTGNAVIRCSISGAEVREYSVQITEVYPQAEGGRDLQLTVTDSELLAKTGGIVRGMSGSPIIQDGRLVGAVTHVLVDNPIKGYGIFIENMLAAEEQQNAA